MDIDRIVTSSARLIEEQYVFPEIGTKLADLLRANLREGRYADADVPGLSALVTADLQSANGDLHLRLKHHAEEIPDKPSEELTVAMFTERSARDLGGIAAVERLVAADGSTVARLEITPLLYPPSMAGDAMAAAMQLVATADVLVLDLRNTVGGDPTMVAFVCGYLFDEPTHLIDIYQRQGDRTTQSWSSPYVPGRRFGGTRPVFVLTSRRTFSGGEELAFDLQRTGRATVVGERTGGGAHPRGGHRMHPHLELTIPTGRALDPETGGNWEGTGVHPDVETPADEALATALRRVP
ncbi:S41 family peptidase [Virgisporangium ochraceum]